MNPPTDFVVVPRDWKPSTEPRQWRLVEQQHIRSGSWQVFGVGGSIEFSPGRSSYTIVHSSDSDPGEVAAHVRMKPRRFAVKATDTGVYAAMTMFRSRPDLLAWTSRPAVRRIYWATSTAGPIIGTHPRIVARLSADVGGRRVAPSTEYIRSILLWGYPMDGTVPYDGVNTLGINDLLHASGDEVRIAPLPRSPHRDLDNANEAEKAALLVDAITDSIGRISTADTPLLRLSGGKDSRVLLAALFALGRKAVTQTRGRPSDTEVRIASALARSVGLEHMIVGTPLSVPGDVKESVLHGFVRTGGFIPSESHQSAYIGPAPLEFGQPLLIGQSHVQRGGFARTMRTDTSASMHAQASPHVSPDLVDYARGYIEQWANRNQRPNSLEQLYEFHVQHRASSYLAAHLVDYSTETNPVYPMIDARFVAICDRLTMLDKVSEKIIYLAAQQMAPQVVQIPLTNGNWRFGPEILTADDFLANAGEPTEYSVYEEPLEPFYPATATSSVDRIAAAIVASDSYSELRPMIDVGFAEKLERAATHGMADALANTEGSLLEAKKFIWRLYDAALWLENFDRWA